ncbi:MAG: hypothetical protein GEU73_16600 [Chloroflexi bacterium]|nr:hypothetical protein [Chloroflexota bacterium]
MDRLVVVATSGDPATLAELAATCAAAVRAGTSVRVFFRDESIPSICKPSVARELAPGPVAAPEDLGLSDTSELGPESPVHAALDELSGSGDVRLFACSSSLYIWGVGGADLIPAISGVRGLVAFLAEDVAGAARVLTY